MKKYFLLLSSLALFIVQAGAQNTASDLTHAQSLLDGNRSLRFEQNVGQIKQMESDATATNVKFVVKSGNHKIFLLNTGLAHQFEQLIYPEGYDPMEDDPRKMQEQEALRERIVLKTYRMDMQLLGANPYPKISTEGKSAYPERYYKEQNYTAWTWEQVTYHDVYPGIDWVVYSRGNDLKYDFVVHPGADPSVIQLELKEAGESSLDKDGSFRWSNPMGWVKENKPLTFQNDQIVESHYRHEDGVLSFELGDYDPTQSLRIDPTLQWGTYFGGTGFDEAWAIAVDGNGNICITGRTSSIAAIATTGAHSTVHQGNGDVFIVKFNSNKQRQWGTYYGGSSDDIGYGIAMDASGNVVVTGYTSSNSGVATSGANQTSIGGSNDAFIAKFNSSGVRQWGTYYGGNLDDRAYGVTTDGSGNFYLTGSCGSNNGIASSGVHQTSYAGGFNDGFIAKFNSSGVRQWGTYYGGSSDDYLRGIALDDNGNILVTGYTQSSSSIATTGAHQTSLGGNFDAFVAKFNNSGIRQWATYYGGSKIDYGYGIATDESGNVYITGETLSSSSIATNGAYQTSSGGSNDAFISKFNSSGVRQWGTYFGGSGTDMSFGIATDGKDNVFIVGSTSSSNGIATTGVHQTSRGGQNDAFISQFNSNGIRQWASYYGGSSHDNGSGIGIDNNGKAYITGYTSSTSGISSTGAYQISNGGQNDAFISSFTILLLPQIVNDPQNKEVCASKPAYFGSSLTGTADSLQWQVHSGNAWSRVKGGTDTFYSINAADTSMDGDSIRVIAFGPGGNDTSGVALLNVQKITQVTLEPQDSTTCPNSAASFTIEAEGAGLSYQWQINTGSGWSGVSGSPYSGASTASLSLSTTDTTMDGYQYRCVVSGNCESDTSDAATLRVYRLPLITKQPIQPESKCGNDSIQLRVESYGTNLSYQWQEKSGSGWVNVGSNSPEYNTGLVYTSDNGTLIRCIVSGSCAPPDTSDSVVIQVRGDQPEVLINGANGITQPTTGQSNGSIDIMVNDYKDFVRYSRWSTKEGINYPNGDDFDLQNAPAGEYYLMLVTREYCIYYEGPYVLGPVK